MDTMTKYQMRIRPRIADGSCEIRNGFRRIVAARNFLQVSLLALAGFVTAADASPLDDQIAAFQQPNATQTEATVTQILETGVAEHRSAEAVAAVQSWLNRNLLNTPQAMFLAGQASEF